MYYLPFKMSRFIISDTTYNPNTCSYIYNDSGFSHIEATIFFLVTSIGNVFPRHKIIVLMVFSAISVFSTCARCACIDIAPLNASIPLSWVKIAYLLTFYNPKLLSLKILSICNLEPITLTCLQIPFSPKCVPFVVKNW